MDIPRCSEAEIQDTFCCLLQSLTSLNLDSLNKAGKDRSQVSILGDVTCQAPLERSRLNFLAQTFLSSSPPQNLQISKSPNANWFIQKRCGAAHRTSKALSSFDVDTTSGRYAARHYLMPRHSFLMPILIHRVRPVGCVLLSSSI